MYFPIKKTALFAELLNRLADVQGRLNDLSPVTFRKASIPICQTIFKHKLLLVQLMLLNGLFVRNPLRYPNQ
ncbi:hypothetical protein PL75_04325 [Neisseria arctica]|uniref:Uncharacterized protein n=2 Tax=Neisseria arctica TaxID=1470200 RepID=A0A0J1C488_9NEIS|nr:hypothetical protein PL75_04325 [Neisseria arctica]